MKGQRNTFIMKGQDITPEKLNEVETGDLPEKEFKAIMIKIIIRLRERMDKQNEKSRLSFSLHPGTLAGLVMAMAIVTSQSCWFCNFSKAGHSSFLCIWHWCLQPTPEVKSF